MSISRREFLQTSALALGVTTLPSWVYSADISGRPIIVKNKEAIADAALKVAKDGGAEYSDIRINKYRIESLAAREKQVTRVAAGENAGFGIRVLYNGTWGFAASPVMTVEEAKRVAAEALSIAKANAAFQTRRIELTKETPVKGTWKSDFTKDPFDVPIDEKVRFLLGLNEAALETKDVSFVNSSMAWVNEQKFIANTEGSRFEQYLIRGWPSFSVTAVDRAKGDFATRNSLRQGLSKGWEFTTDYDWVGEAKTAGEEAVMKLKAKPIEPGKYDLVLNPSHLFSDDSRVSRTSNRT